MMRRLVFNRYAWTLGMSGAFLVWPVHSCVAQERPAVNAVDESHAHAVEGVHSKFMASRECALCHSFSLRASAMRDTKNRNVAPYDLWQGSMMAQSARDPYWKAAVSAEIIHTPQQKSHIEEVCTRCHAPMVVGPRSSPEGESLAFLKSNVDPHGLGADGVSCTVCHQISSQGLGTESSYTGGFQIGDQRILYGPHANPVTMPMQRHVAYTPAQGTHILESALCATCHNVITESFRADGVATNLHLHEQVPYLEWRNSDFSTEGEHDASKGKSCQQCHVPTVDQTGQKISTRLAHNPGGRDFPFLQPRQPIGRHTFAGGNVFMTKLLRDHREELGIPTPAVAFDRVIDDSMQMLEHQTAQVSLSTASKQPGIGIIRVRIDNLAGHKFPTAYPSRRAWIYIEVRSSQGDVVFASGAFDSQGRIIDLDGVPLSTEKAGGAIQPHLTRIQHSDQVIIYETIMEDEKGDVTFALLRGGRFQKDNRILPRGWRSDHAEAQATQPQGVDGDEDFRAGGDEVSYELRLPAGTYRVEAKLVFQSLSSRYVDELFQLDTPEIRSFRKLYEKADRTPITLGRSQMTLEVR